MWWNNCPPNTIERSRAKENVLESNVWEFTWLQADGRARPRTHIRTRTYIVTISRRTHAHGNGWDQQAGTAGCTGTSRDKKKRDTDLSRRPFFSLTLRVCVGRFLDRHLGKAEPLLEPRSLTLLDAGNCVNLRQDVVLTMRLVNAHLLLG